MAVGISDGLYILQPAPTPIPGERANHPNPGAQFHANERKEGRDANPKSAIPRQRAQGGERCQPPTPRAQSHPKECGTNPPKRMRKSRGPSIHPRTRPITITPPDQLDHQNRNHRGGQTPPAIPIRKKPGPLWVKALIKLRNPNTPQKQSHIRNPQTKCPIATHNMPTPQKPETPPDSHSRATSEPFPENRLESHEIENIFPILTHG